METMQAPNIEPGAKGRLVYDKKRRTIVGKQVKTPHPLAPFGYSTPPHWLWRISPQLFVFVGSIKDIWYIVTGKLTLHKAWQAGHDHGARSEYERTVINGGR